MRNDEIERIEAIIGYTFRDKSRLMTALTHASYVNEHGGESNERLEFLGDSVLGLIVAQKLYAERSGNEGALTKEKASIVSQVPLAHAVDDMGLTAFYRMGKGATQAKGNGKEKFRSNLFEAVLGAIYLDGGMESAVSFTQSKLIDPHYRGEESAKTLLQERVAKTGSLPQYAVEQIGNGFKCCLTLGEKNFYGMGDTKSAAEHDAAKKALAAF
ncbi:MAG: ribonuclease III [Clostridiales bacterium]|nr:ribonuclease III [Clostridiales bacterium]